MCTAGLDRTTRRARGLRCAPFVLQLIAGCSGSDPLPSELRDGGDSSDARDAGDASDAGDAGDASDVAVHHSNEPLPPGRGLFAVFGTAPDDVWVAGELGTLAHFDGSGFHVHEIDTLSPLHGLHGSGPNDVWAVGQHTVWRWDGRDWTEVLRDPGATLLDVWVSPRGEAWIVGHSQRYDRALLQRWDGVEWSTHVLDTALTFWAVWGSPEGQVWIAGSALGGEGIVLSGTAEEGVDPASYTGLSVRDVWGASDDDVWVAAYQGGFQHWDGSGWIAFEAPDDARVMSAMGAGPERAWAVGLHGLILRFDGEGWTADESGTDLTLMDIWASGEDDAWAVGSDATVLHWDGETWRNASETVTDAEE